MTQIGLDLKTVGVAAAGHKRADVRSASTCHVVKFMVLPQLRANAVAEPLALSDIERGSGSWLGE